MNRFAENKHVIIEETSPNRPNTTNKVQRSTSQTHFTPKYEESPAGGNNEIINQIGSGPKRSSSGLLSIFKWFKKNPDRDNIYSSSSSSSSSTTASNSSLNNDESTNTPNPLSRNQSAASVDSLFSTATVASFTYIPPAVYNPFGNAEIPEKLIAPGPETNTHKNRMKQLEKVRERDKNITLRKKYKLFSGDNTTNKNKTNSNSKKNKKNKKDTIVNTNRDYCELSLPLIKCQNKNSMDKSVDDNNKSDNNRSVIKSHHRRTVSESSKDKKAGAYCHVKGKRRAPPPPSQNNTETTIKNDENTNTLTRKMKRQAPQPPASTSENNQTTSNLTKEQKDFLITNIAKLQSTQSNSVEIMTSQNGINELINNVPDVVCNDSLKLESGILKPVKETLKTTDNKNEKKSVTASPISPKPWYKRTLSSSSSNRDSLNHSSSHFRKEFAKHHSKSEGNDDNLFKYPKENSKLSNVLSRFSMSSDERKKDENRKSAISMLANISELDREAALIVQKEQNKMQAQIDAQNEAFYSPSNSQNDVPGFLMSQQQEQQQKNTCKKGSARELISKFNALTSATRISVNSALFSSNKEDNRNSRRFSYQSTENDIKNKYSPFSVVTPPMKRSIFKLEEFSEKDEEVLPTPMWKSNDTNFEPKIVNTPPNIMKYFEPQKTESKVDDKTLDEQPKNNLATEVKKDGWTCTRCTLENGRMDLKCVACGMWKPFGKVVDKYFGPQKDNKSNDKDVKPTNEKTQNLENETKMARTFAENVFKAFEMDDEADKKLDEVKSENDTVKETAIVSSVTVVEPELSLEELRKARLARFSQNLDDLENIPKSPPPEKEEKQNDLNEVKTNKSESCDPQLSLSASNKLLSEEQKKLRKMLKEMRDSLPKTGSTLTPKSTLEKVPIKEDVELKIVEENDLKNDEIKNKEIDTGIKDVSKGAIPKVFNKTSPKPVIVDEILKNKEEKVITAYVITKETTYENIKVRKENVDLDKPIKVSASSQTQSVKVTTKPPLGRENIMLPLSVEEMSTPAKTTISRVGSFGKGQFELIRAKDFAGISSNVTTPDSPLYANLPATLETLEKTSITASPSNSSSQQSINNSSSEEEILSVQLSDPEGIKDFKATLRQDKHNANTLAINRLLRRLETAIASGQHVQAAKLAKDLARLKVNCSVTRQKKIETPNTKYITADMYVEDQVTHQGPIPLRVNPDMTIADLKQKVAQEFEIPSHVQRWILDRQLASDDEMTLGELNINFDGCPMFLYLVAPDGEFDVETLKRASKRVRDGIKTHAVEEDLEQSDSETNEEEEAENAVNEATNDANDIQNIIPPNMWRCPVCTLLNTLDRPGCEACSTERPRSVEPKQKNYLQLMDLDNTDLVSNIEPFECLICFTECQIGEGVILRECLHSFCKECLAHTIEYTEEVEIKCPYRDSDYSCDLVLQEREIKALVSKEIYEQHLALSVKQAETKIDNAFHCKTPDCRGWCIFEDNVNEFKCPVCKANNCLTCQVIHEGLNCKQYQEQLNQNSESNVEARRTKDFLDEMVSRGEAMVCPTCQVVLMKKWGCDWLRCSMCKTEICWVTRGPRWGPTGKGDVTGGCKCGVNGIKCHPKCTYCH